VSSWSSARRACFGFILVLGLYTLLRPAAAVQPPPVGPPPTSAAPLLIRSAGYVFVGTVTGVERIASAQRHAVPTVRVTFRVDQAIRGVRAGQILEIHEWAGLWQSGERYSPGERVLLFLYRPSRLGLTSPVGGPMGRFPVDNKGQIMLQPFQIPALSADPAVRNQLRGKVRFSLKELARYVHQAKE
jgi:hypothetical protein